MCGSSPSNSNFSSGAFAICKAARTSEGSVFPPADESFRVRRPVNFRAISTRAGPIAFVRRTSSSCRNDRFGGGGGDRGQLDNVDGLISTRKKQSQAADGISGFLAIRITSARAVPPHQMRESPRNSPCKSSPVSWQPEKLIREISG